MKRVLLSLFIVYAFAEIECGIATCGCKDIGGTCEGLGTCSINPDGNPVCSCNEGFAGEYCSKCSANHYNYPLCTRCLNGGKWDSSAKVCRCAGKWTGMICDVCADGWTGKTCEIKIATSPITYIFFCTVLVLATVAILMIGFTLFNKFANGRPSPFSEPVAEIDETLLCNDD